MLDWRYFFNKSLFRHKYKSLSEYSAALYSAQDFTTNKGFRIDSLIASNVDIESFKIAVSDIANGFDEQITFYQTQGRDVYNALGGDCGNIHKLILKYIKQYYSSLPVNITIGEVKIDENNDFSFGRDKFCSWLVKKPDILDCHVWLTIGDEYILDATIGTYINTRIDKTAAFGGICYGKPGHLMWQTIANKENRTPDQIQGVKFSPIVLGESALDACAPPAMG